MTEQELRALVRQAIARHAGTSGEGPLLSPYVGRVLPDPNVLSDSALMHRHTSHAMFVVPAGADLDGPCIIEPAVMCHHCGYCKSYGH